MQEKVAGYDATAPRRRAAHRADLAPASAPHAPPAPAQEPLVAPAGFRLADTWEGLAGTALVGKVVLYRWLVEGWIPPLSLAARCSLLAARCSLLAARCSPRMATVAEGC